MAVISFFSPSLKLPSGIINDLIIHPNKIIIRLYFPLSEISIYKPLHNRIVRECVSRDTPRREKVMKKYNTYIYFLSALDDAMINDTKFQLKTLTIDNHRKQ